jgi:hypothetical protein
MTTPFREPADSPTATALARLEAMPVHPIRRACAAVARYREATVAQAHAKHIASAEARGFKFVGRAAEGLYPIYRKQVFVDAPRTTQAQLSTRGYFFITYYESGKCVITWDHVPQTPSSDVLDSRGTAGSFDADLDAHLAAVKKLSATDAPIAVPDLHTAVTLGRFYYRGVVPLGLAVSMLMSVALPFVAVAVALYWLIRRVHAE